jgi:hypothetical protein
MSVMSGEAAMLERLVRVETAITGLRDEILRRFDSDVAPLKQDHETRLRQLEQKVQRAGGIAAAFGTLFGAGASTLISWLVSHKP